MNKICFSIGISRKLHRLEQDVIFNFIKSQFGGLTLEEITEAFTLHSGCKFQFWWNGRQVNTIPHFDKFSTDYVGNVLNKYQQYIADQRQKVDRTAPEKFVREPYTPEVGKKQFEFIKKCFEKDGKPPFIANWMDAFKWMEDEKIIELEDIEKEAIKNAVINQMHHEVKERRSKKKDVTNLLQSIETGRGVKYECRKKCVIDYFTNLISK